MLSFYMKKRCREVDVIKVTEVAVQVLQAFVMIGDFGLLSVALQVF